MSSILNSVKKSCGIDPEYTHFDGELIMHINTVINTLNQLGVRKANRAKITGSSEDWNMLIDNDNLNNIETYVCMKVRMMFDPPASSSVSKAFEETIRELESRINMEVDPPENNVLGGAL